MSDLDIILQALISTANLAEYSITGPDLLYKLQREIERIREIEEKKEQFAHEAAMNEIKND